MSSETITPSEEELRVREWRFRQFVQYGFDEDDASYLAENIIDHHLVKRMVDGGCSQSVILRICL